MAINLFVPFFHVDEALAEIRECLEKGWTGLGYKTVEFEEKWKDYSGLPNAHFLCSNTAGLHLAVHILKNEHGWHDGDEIISTPLTFISTNHAIAYERLKPVFADVDEYLCLDPESVESRITPRTRAVMFVGIGGNVGRLLEVVEICRQKRLSLILDAAHMAGTRIGQRHVGAEADVAVFSFQAVKNLPTADAGCICFEDSKLDKVARELSWLGINKDTYQRFAESDGGYRWKYDVNRLGFKYHGNSVVAAIGLAELRHLDEGNRRRRELATLYDRLLQEGTGAMPVPTAAACESSRHLYQVIVDRRAAVLQHFYENEIFPGVHYADNTEYPMYRYAQGTCPRAMEISRRVISLPLHLRLSEEDCCRVVHVLKEAIAKCAQPGKIAVRG